MVVDSTSDRYIDRRSCTTPYPAAGWKVLSLWIPRAHQLFDGTARKVDGRWLFAHSDVTVATKDPTP